MTDDVIRLKFWLEHQASGVKNSSIYVCHYGTEPHAYALNFANGSSKTHCSNPECIAAARLELHERNREQSNKRFRAIMALRTA